MWSHALTFSLYSSLIVQMTCFFLIAQSEFEKKNIFVIHNGKDSFVKRKYVAAIDSFIESYLTLSIHTRVLSTQIVCQSFGEFDILYESFAFCLYEIVLFTFSCKYVFAYLAKTFAYCHKIWLVLYKIQ